MNSMLVIIIGALFIYLAVVFILIPLIDSAIKYETNVPKLRVVIMKLTLLILTIMMVGFLITYLTILNFMDFMNIVGG